MKTFLDYVQRHGFALFAWWRVIVGTLGLIALALGYGRVALGAVRPRWAQRRRGAPELAGLAEPPEIGRHDRSPS